jgi:SAM-dependent methyltransferase
VDISQRFVDLAAATAPAGATFVRGDARHLAALPEVGAASFDAAISLCQGAFGLVGPGADEEVLAGMVRALRPGGVVAVSAFSSYFSVRYQATDEGGATFDAATATASERTEVRSETGEAREVELHTTCYTPRELALLAGRAGLEVAAVWSVEPGAYGRNPPTIETAEFLLLARRPR